MARLCQWLYKSKIMARSVGVQLHGYPSSAEVGRGTIIAPTFVNMA